MVGSAGSKEFKIICTGSRDWTARDVVFDALAEVLNDPAIPIPLPTGVVIIHGAAKGLDTIVGELAPSFGFQVRPYPADWTTFGKGAGPIRNRQMLDENPDTKLCLAFHDDLEHSKGTLHMVRYAASHRVKIIVYRSDGSYADYYYHPFYTI